MFPPQLPHVFIRWLTEPGDAVYDPFSGRGTVALEAVLTGRRAYASDANPLAVALSAAKVRVPTRSALRRRITNLENSYRPADASGVPDRIRMLYASGTLSQLAFLRRELIGERPGDAFLIATLLGLLHGNHSKGGATRGLSISMPNTFAMAPGYVRRYIETHGLKAPEVDVFAMLRRRLEQLDLPASSVEGGDVWKQDAKAESPMWLREEKVKLVFTSPPYLQTIKYGKYNWVRLWFLGHEPKTIDERLTDTASLDRYRTFMRATLQNLEGIVRPDGFVCLVIGDVRQRDSKRRTSERHDANPRDAKPVDLAGDVWETVAKPAGWRLHGVVADHMPSGPKVSRIWKDNPGRATKTDRILILSRGGDTCELPALDRISWKKRSDWQTAVAAGGSK
jgi:site-specific DNA-methyltransferase (adenine-specific)